jgi:hypothetical protein
VGLSAEQAASITAIATEAGGTGVPSTDEARLAAIERPTKEARLRETPVTVALHRCAEGLIEATAYGRST